MKALIFVAVLVSVLATGCWQKEQPVEKKEVIRPVRYIEVRARTAARVRTFSGVSRAALESKLSFKVNGSIKQLLVKVGDRVTAGRTIATVDGALYRLRVQEALAGLQQARALLRNADNSYKRIQKLYINKTASPGDLDGARAQFESSRASVVTMEKKLARAKLELAYTRLDAPISGAIADVTVELNENVRAGQPVVLLSTSSELEVEVVIPEVFITDIREGRRVDVTFDALKGKSLTGTVTEVAVSSIASATTFPVTVKIEDSSALLRPGMAAEVSFHLSAATPGQRFVVPTYSVASDGERTYANG